MDELTVPREALEAVCETIAESEQYIDIDKTIALGLLEISPDGSVRVPRILPLELSGDVESLSKKAAGVLYRLWCEDKEISTEEQALEICPQEDETEKAAIIHSFAIIYALPSNFTIFQ